MRKYEPKELTIGNKIGTGIGLGILILGLINIVIGLARLYFIAFDGIDMDNPKNEAFWIIGGLGIGMTFIGALTTVFNYFVKPGGM